MSKKQKTLSRQKIESAILYKSSIEKICQDCGVSEKVLIEELKKLYPDNWLKIIESIKNKTGIIPIVINSNSKIRTKEEIENNIKALEKAIDSLQSDCNEERKTFEEITNETKALVEKLENLTKKIAIMEKIAKKVQELLENEQNELEKEKEIKTLLITLSDEIFINGKKTALKSKKTNELFKSLLLRETNLSIKTLFSIAQVLAIINEENYKVHFENEEAQKFFEEIK